MRWRSSSRTPLSAGIVPGADPTGAGSRDAVVVGRLFGVEIRRLIREMSLANPLWGAPRIHGELLKLGIDIGQTSVAKYMARRRGPPSQGWKTFLNNHADGIAAMDLFVVPTISFRLLYGLLDHRAWPAADSLVWRHIASDRRMDGKSAHGSLRLGTGSPLSDPRSGRGL